jgi:hypothetical protein
MFEHLSKRANGQTRWSCRNQKYPANDHWLSWLSSWEKSLSINIRQTPGAAVKSLKKLKKPLDFINYVVFV